MTARPLDLANEVAIARVQNVMLSCEFRTSPPPEMGQAFEAQANYKVEFILWHQNPIHAAKLMMKLTPWM